MRGSWESGGADPPELCGGSSEAAPGHSGEMSGAGAKVRSREEVRSKFAFGGRPNRPGLRLDGGIEKRNQRALSHEGGVGVGGRCPSCDGVLAGAFRGRW